MLRIIHFSYPKGIILIERELVALNVVCSYEILQEIEHLLFFGKIHVSASSVAHNQLMCQNDKKVQGHRKSNVHYSNVSKKCTN